MVKSMKKYTFLLAGSSVAIASMLFMVNSISGKTEERKEINTSPVVKEKGVESKSEEWERYFPRQYDSWKKTRQNDKIDDQLEKYPQLGVLWAGYAFSKDYNAPRPFLRCPGCDKHSEDRRPYRWHNRSSAHGMLELQVS